MITKTSVVGLGKLGLCQAAVLAERGLEVIGVDIDDSKVQALNGGSCPIFEPHLAETLAANRERTKGTRAHSEAVANSDVTFVIVPTPSTPSGGFSLKYVLGAVKAIGWAIRSKSRRHLVVITSTVMPGSMKNDILPELEAASGLKCPKEVGLCYNPEFIALGDVINGMLNPDLILIGESDRKSGNDVEAIQHRICKNSPEVARMSFVNAELTKLSINSFVTMKISFANTLAEMCENLAGADVDTVTRAVGADKRIGRAYLKGAAGYGGPCFPRDNIAFSRLAKRIGAQAYLAQTTHKINTEQAARLVTLARKARPRRGVKVSVLGLAYKPNTDVVVESPGVAACEALAKCGFEVHAHDPAAMENAKRILEDNVKFYDTAEKAVKGTDLCIVMTSWDEYRRLKPSALAGKVLLDVWRLLPHAREYVSKYVVVGKGETQRGGLARLSWE